MTRTKGKAVQNDLEMKGSCSVLFDEALGSSCPGNNEGRGKANGITQVSFNIVMLTVILINLTAGVIKARLCG